MAMPPQGWYSGCDGRAIDTGQHLQDAAPHDHQSTGIAGTDTGLGTPLGNGLQGQVHGGILASSQGKRRALIHGHYGFGVKQLQARMIQLTQAFQYRSNLLLMTDQQNVQGGMTLECVQCRRHRNAGTEVPAHCINGDAMPCCQVYSSPLATT
eukprot:Anaeramoba_flamelloidesc42165_g1_i8.p4 GENE.c42165_g1_i8~~c42165_g1_i8.p4  ORF type:complete len:153 (+),score=11.47 c42165_g1_i8:222-680(+)